MSQKKELYLRTLGFFIITLIVSLPFYSASVMAQETGTAGAGVEKTGEAIVMGSVGVQIVKNSGQKNIEKFIDASGDVWTVQALITGVTGTINPQRVKIKIGTHESPFNTCSDSPLGKLCEYISPLTEGVEEATYSFRVVYTYLEAGEEKEAGSQGDVVNADGSAPKIIFNIGDVFEDSEGKVNLKFTVNERVNPNMEVLPVGIKQIEVIDAEKNTILQTLNMQTLNNFEQGKLEFDYALEGGSNGKIPVSFEGQGTKKIKIKAEDWLGHSATSSAMAFESDFVRPEIKEDSLELPSLGKFIGQYVRTTAVKIAVVDKNQPRVLAVSEQAGLQNRAADNNCLPDRDISELWHCQWENVVVQPGDAVVIKFTATDTFGNSAEKTITKTFTTDTTAPVLVYFGSERTFGESGEVQGYISSGAQRIILQVREQGSGMSESNNWEGVRADLRALGGELFAVPNFCNQTAELFECYWETKASLSSGGEATVTLSKLEDRVGNVGELKSVVLKIDSIGPKVESLKVYGIGESGEEKDYLQSADKLRMKMRVNEGTGLVVLVNLNELVMNSEEDIETKYPENEYTRGLGGGWKAFTEKDCQRVKSTVEGTISTLWDCVFETESVKSGPDKLGLEIKVRDTAGNDASAWPEEKKVKNVEFGHQGSAGLWSYGLELLSSKTEDNPNYWEVKNVLAGNDFAGNVFVDLDTTTLIPARMPFTVNLVSSVANVEAIDIKLVKCVAAGDISNALTGKASEDLAPEELGAPTIASAESVPVLSRSLLYNSVSAVGEPNPKPKIVLEFEPFDGRELFKISNTARERCRGGADVCKWTAEYVCQLRIFSKVGRSALVAPEMQIVKITVPFAFSEFGAQDENLAEMIKEARDEVDTGFWGVMGSLNKVLRWVDYGVQVVGLVMGGISIVNGAQIFTESLKTTPGGQTPALAVCLGLKTVEQKMDEGIQAINWLVEILSCRPVTAYGGLGWYSSLSENMLTYFNNLNALHSAGYLASGNLFKSRSEDEKKASSPIQSPPVVSLRENLFLSTATLCLPGIIKNLDKWRQVKCRKIYCLENEVKGGLATVSQCDELESLLFCKYIVGQLWYLIPFSQMYDFFVSKIGEAWKDPLAAAHTVIITGCAIHCKVGGSLSAGCSYAYYLWEVFGYLEQIVSFIMTVKADLESGGLQYCDSVLK